MSAREGHASARRAARWFSWLVGLAMLAAVVAAGLHFSEERSFLRIAETARPWWFVLAVLLQAATYLAQGETFRVVTRAAKIPVPLGVAYELSLAKLFVDQALPSAGISGTVVLARALEARGIPGGVVMASVVVATISYYAAYVLALGLALGITLVGGHASPLIVGAALLFVLLSVALTALALALSNPRRPEPRWVARVRPLAHALSLLREADPRLAHNIGLIAVSALYQLAIVFFDTATMWILIRSLGVTASPTAVFASFMLSTLLRTIGFAPGGLGTFEAASVVTLKLAGVPVAVALSATLLFRGLSFWLPMAPGLFFSRRIQDET